MKIIASDYDGTLNHGGVDDRKREAIARWRAAGNRFGLVSGRGPDSLVELARRDGITYDFLLACSGAVICTPDGKILKENRCDGKLAKPLLKLMIEMGAADCTGYSDDTFRVLPERSADHPDDFTLETLPEIPYFTQISAGFYTIAEADRLTEAIRERFGDELNPLQNGCCLDVVHKSMDKAQGIYALLTLLGADYDDVITVGDNVNDTAMIAEFRSYAMENGAPSIKALANATTPGIVELIERELEMMSPMEKMRSGELYLPGDDEIMAEQTACLDRQYDFNQTRPTELAKRTAMLREMFAEIGEGTYIEPPLHANWGGKHCHFGKNVYANFNLTLVDDTDIYVGDGTMFGPNVVIATAGHPLHPPLREQQYQYNVPVRIGKNCWLGAGVLVMPGVTIGDNSVIGAGSVVTKDIPANVVAVGNPCRVLRELGEHDREFYWRDRKIDPKLLEK